MIRVKYLSIKDHLDISKIFQDEWNMGKIESKAKGNVCGFLYWIKCLYGVNELSIIRNNGRIVGLSGYSPINYAPRRFSIWNLIYYLVYNNKFLIKNKNGLKMYHDNYELECKDADIDCELNIIILGKDIKGHGNGRKILTEVFNKARNDGFKHMVIHTDESCNYKFYESMGCYIIDEKITDNLEKEKLKSDRCKVFLYRKDL